MRYWRANRLEQRLRDKYAFSSMTSSSSEGSRSATRGFDSGQSLAAAGSLTREAEAGGGSLFRRFSSRRVNSRGSPAAPALDCGMTAPSRLSPNASSVTKRSTSRAPDGGVRPLDLRLQNGGQRIERPGELAGVSAARRKDGPGRQYSEAARSVGVEHPVDDPIVLAISIGVPLQKRPHFRGDLVDEFAPKAGLQALGRSEMVDQIGVAHPPSRRRSL